MADHPTYGRIDGPLVMIGFGSVGKGVWPLIARHLDFDREKLIVIEPDARNHAALAEIGLRVDPTPLTPENTVDILNQHLEPGTGFCVNLSVGTGALEMMRHCRSIGVPYIDTGPAPWADEAESNAARSTYARRQAIRDEASAHPGGSTAISSCGATPGAVSWFVKAGLLRLAQDMNHQVVLPQTRGDWAALMRDLGVTGLHIAESDSQARATPRPRDAFLNTWSVEALLARSFLPAELGWGTHETWFPEDGYRHEDGCQAAIWLDRPGALTRVHSWCPSSGPQFGFLISDQAAISIADYYTIGDAAAPEYRPTCHYAYRPCNDAVLSLHETFGSGRSPAQHHILEAHEIVEGGDDLGVLLYGHAKNALWYGARLSNDAARSLAPAQNAKGLQVSSAVLAGMVWALENPDAGIVEADEMDPARCLEIQMPYLGAVEAHYTDWTPLQGRLEQFPEDIDETDPWLFRNVLAR